MDQATTATWRCGAVRCGGLSDREPYQAGERNEPRRQSQPGAEPERRTKATLTLEPSVGAGAATLLVVHSPQFGRWAGHRSGPPPIHHAKGSGEIQQPSPRPPNTTKRTKTPIARTPHPDPVTPIPLHTLSGIFMGDVFMGDVHKRVDTHGLTPVALWVRTRNLTGASIAPCRLSLGIRHSA